MPPQLSTTKTNVVYHPESRMVVVEAVPGATFEAKDTWETHGLIHQLIEDCAVGVVFACDGDIVTTPEMRQICASPEFNTHFIAVALISPSTAMKIVGNFYLRLYRPPVPTRFFSKRELGHTWLKEHIALAPHNKVYQQR